MKFWKPPELPKVEKMPTRSSPAAQSKSPIARSLGGVAGVVLATASLIGLWRALQDTSGKGNPIMPLALMLPAVLLVRYALTGKIKKM